MSNPYSAPTADLAVDRSGDQEYQPRVFALNGRVGRLRYLGYTLAIMGVMWLGMTVISVVLALSSSTGRVFTTVVPALLGFIILGVSLIPARRRLHDLNRSGWLVLLMLIPLINFFLGLYLLFGRGSDGENDYGPAPCKNPRGLLWVVLVVPVVIVAIIAAVAIPAYQGYVNKARAAARQDQQTSIIPSFATPIASVRSAHG